MDHIIPLHKARSPQEFHKLCRDDNCQMLCIPCHVEKTSEDMDYSPRGVDVSGNPIDHRHPWNAQ